MSEEVTITTPTTPTSPSEDNIRLSAKRLYEDEASNSLKILVVLCEGLKDEGGTLVLDLEKAPWSHIRPRTRIKPSLDDYRREVQRRWKDFVSSLEKGEREPRPKNWKTEKCVQWLHEHPITFSEEVSYLREVVSTRKKVEEEAVESQRQERDLLEKNWTGDVPYLRLIHCLIDHEDVREAFVRRNDVAPGRMEIENRNSISKRCKTVWEMMADKWNDPSFFTETEAIPIHFYFADTFLLEYSQVQDLAKATPEKCKQKFHSMVNELNICVQKWEKSGQGDGGELAEDDDEDNEPLLPNNEGYGSLKGRSQGALDCIHSFFEYNQLYLVYLWYQLDKYGLLGSSLQRLNEKFSTGDGASSVPSVFDMTGEENETEGDVSTDGNLAIRTLNTTIDRLGDKNLEAARLMTEEQQKDRKQKHEWDLSNKIENLKAEKRKLQRELANIDDSKKHQKMVSVSEMQLEEIDDDIAEKRNQLAESKLATKQQHKDTRLCTIVILKQIL